MLRKARGSFKSRSVLASALVIPATLALAVLGGVAGASHDAYRHLSAGGVNGNGAVNAFFRGASADGSRVFFTTAEQLVSADADSTTDVYERSAGTTTRISAGQVNGNGAADVVFRGASADGSRVFFESGEPLVSDDTDAALDVYERAGGTTRRVSAGQVNGNAAFTPASFEDASADGSRVFFSTDEQLVGGDTDSSRDVYQRAGGRTKPISAGQVNGNGAFDATFRGASVDGSRVFFHAEEQLVGTDTDAAQDVYERSGGTTRQVSAGQVNGNGPSDAAFAGASADGSRVFFITNEQLVGADADGSEDVYERSGGSTSRISIGNGGFNAFFEGASADGSRVFFETNEQLVGADTDGARDVYERTGGSTRLRSTGRVSGNGPRDAAFVGASADGSRVFFHTSEQLGPGDTDTSNDVYERSSGTTKLISAGSINGNGALAPPSSAPPQTARGSSSRRSSSSSRPTPTASWICTSARGQRRAGSRPATARSLRSSVAPQRTARRSSSAHRRRWS